MRAANSSYQYNHEDHLNAGAAGMTDIDQVIASLSSRASMKGDELY